MQPTGKAESEQAIPPSPGPTAGGSTVPRTAPATPDGAGAVPGPSAAPGKVHAAARPALVCIAGCSRCPSCNATFHFAVASSSDTANTPVYA